MKSRLGLAALTCVIAAAPVTAGESAPRENRRADAAASHTAAQAGAQGFSESADRARRRTQTLRQVSGKIQTAKLVDVRGTTTRNLVVLIQTTKSGKRLIVDLGPVRALRHDEANPYSAVLDSNEELQLERGRSIAVEGVVERVADTQLLIARRVRQGQRTMSIQRTAQAAQAREQRRSSSASPRPGSTCEPAPP